MAKEVKQWITVNGHHVPIFEGESKADAVKRAVNKQGETKKTSEKKAPARKQLEKVPKHVTGKNLSELHKNLEEQGLGMESVDAEDIKRYNDMNGEKVSLYDAYGNEYRGTFNKYSDGGMEVVNIKKEWHNRKPTDTYSTGVKEKDEVAKEKQITENKKQADERNGIPTRSQEEINSGKYDKYKQGMAYKNAKTVQVNGKTYKVWGDTNYKGTFAEDENGNVLPIHGSGYLTKELSQRKAIANKFGEPTFRKTGKTEKSRANETPKIDNEKLWDIAERYNTSIPVSGNWNDETSHEQKAIAKEFGISLGQAKKVMIDKLGYPEKLEEGDHWATESKQAPKQNKIKKILGKGTSEKEGKKSTEPKQQVKSKKFPLSKSDKNAEWKITKAYDRASLTDLALDAGLESSYIRSLPTDELRAKLLAMWKKG